MVETATIQGDRINALDLQAALGSGFTYEDIVKNFSVFRSEFYNMAQDSVDRQAAGPNRDACALVVDRGTAADRSYSFAELSGLSDRFASFLRRSGVAKGDVIACYAGQGLESAMAHLGAYKIGAVVAPLSQLYGPEAIRHVLSDCRAKVIVTEDGLWPKIADVVDGCASLEMVIMSGACQDGQTSFDEALATPADDFAVTETRWDDPALLLYTSGSTGMPKGILHRQGLLRGYLSSVSLFYELEMNTPDRVLWTVSDWSWVAGIFNVMLTGWFFGQIVLAGPTRFSADWAFGFMEKHGVTHCFLTPTALKRMAVVDGARQRWPGLALRAIGTGGEPLPGAVLDWADREFGIPINEFYGLTEVNHLIGNCRKLWPIKPGSMGRPYPGHNIAVVDESGTPLAEGVVGEIVASQDDPTLFIGYWNQPERTAQMRLGEWIRTGDYGYRDKDGYFWYEGRQDDLIKSAGFRIGPAEIEDSLVAHPAVEEAAVIGAPDPDRGQIVKAFVRLREGTEPGDGLARVLQQHVKESLAVFKYPREIVFVDSFPLTSTGKINRKQLKQAELDARDTTVKS